MDIEITDVYQKEALTNIINRYGNFSYVDAKDVVKQIEINKSNTPIKIYDIPDYLFDHMYRICKFKKINKMEKHQFKPFDKVLVRDIDSAVWEADFYSHYRKTDAMHQCVASNWEQCIPYNEETAHLIGTNKPYKEPEPKVWQIASTGYNDTMTSEELSNFIQGAVINNKDITDFRIRYIGQ